MIDSIFEHSYGYKHGSGPLCTIYTTCGQRGTLPVDALIKLPNNKWQWVPLLKPGDRVQLLDSTPVKVERVVPKEETDRTTVSEFPPSTTTQE